MDDDGEIAHFTSITGASAEQAAQYVRLADGNLEGAIQLFFESGPLDLAATESEPSSHPPAAQPPPNRSQRMRSAGYQDESGVVHLDDSDGEGDVSDNNDPEITGYGHRSRPPPITQDSRSAIHTPASNTPPTAAPTSAVENDAALARRLQEEMYAGGDDFGELDDDGVRAPIGRTTETLVGPGSETGYSNPGELRDAVMRQIQERERSRANGRPGIFNQRDVSSAIWNEEGGDSEVHRERLSRATGGASESSSKSNMLAAMYRPPFEIMTNISWDQARELGRDKEKWLLVNIQDPSIFDCQILNRDVWKHPGIVDTVKENFIFLQFTKDDPRGSQYMQYYFQNRDNHESYPHIAIVDPRTGEQVKVWSGRPVPTAPDFLIQLHEFLDRYSLKRNARNPVAKRKPEAKKEKTLDQMTEEEMMEMALKNSLAGQESGTREEDPDDLTRSVGDIGKGKEKMTEDDDDLMEVEPTTANGQAISSIPVTSPFTSIPSDHPHIEPAADPTNTRIQFRHSGGRVVRRFALSDPVRRIYEWLKATPLEGKEGVEFELVYLSKNLMDSVENTIEEAGLQMATVMIEFLED